jgi:hypothetical protein
MFAADPLLFFIIIVSCVALVELKVKVPLARKVKVYVDPPRGRVLNFIPEPNESSDLIVTKSVVIV